MTGRLAVRCFRSRNMKPNKTTGETELTFEFPQMKGGDDRLSEMILYVCAKCADDPSFGATKLNKILWCSDFIAYFERGEPITGTAYQRLSKGPAPKYLVPTRRKMIHRRELGIEPRSFFNKVVERPVALRPAKIDGLFKSTDIAIVDEVIRKLWGVTALTVSELSHLSKCWTTAKDGELIPYESVFLADNEITEQDIAETKELAAKHGWE